MRVLLNRAWRGLQPGTYYAQSASGGIALYRDDQLNRQMLKVTWSDYNQAVNNGLITVGPITSMPPPITDPSITITVSPAAINIYRSGRLISQRCGRTTA